MGSKVIELKNINKDYYIYRNNIQRILGIVFDKRPAEVKSALQNISFSVEKGERIVVLGKIDSGCTSLLKVINGIIYPTKGKLTVKGNVNGFLNRKVGYDYELTSYENIFMKANALGLSKDMVKTHFDEICDFAEITEHYLKIPIKNAPRGTIIRLAIILHSLVKSDVFINDETMTLGGSESRKKCEKKILQYLDEDKDRIFITTNCNTAFVKSICTRAIVLERGKILFDGDVEEGFEVFEAQNKKGKQTEKKIEE